MSAGIALLLATGTAAIPAPSAPVAPSSAAAPAAPVSSATPSSAAAPAAPVSSAAPSSAAAAASTTSTAGSAPDAARLPEQPETSLLGREQPTVGELVALREQRELDAQRELRRGAAGFSRLAPAGFDAASALQAAAHALFRPPRGTVFRIEHVGQRSEPELAAEIDVYEVSSDETGPVGAFTRLRCWPAADSTVDLALRLEDGGVKTAVSVRPLVIAGAAYASLPSALGASPEVPAFVWAPVVAGLFGALADSEACLAGPATDGGIATRAAATLAELELVHPPLLPGAAFPEVRARDLEGRPFSPGKVAGRATLVLAASVKHEMSRRVIEHIGRYARERAGRFQVIFVLADQPAAIAGFRARGGRLDGLVLVDADRSARQSLQVSTLPTLFAFDDHSRLAGYRRAPWPTYDELAAQLDRVPIAGASEPAPAPSAPPSTAAENAPRRGKQKPKPKKPARTSPLQEPSPSPSAVASPSPSSAVPAGALSQPAETTTTASVPQVDPADLVSAWRKLSLAMTPPPESTEPAPGTHTSPNTDSTPPVSALPAKLTASVRRTLERFTHGTALQRVDILDERDDVLVTLIRVVVTSGIGTRIDLLVAPDSGGVRAIEPLAPVRVEGRELTLLKELFAAVTHHAMDAHGPALARFFMALAHVARASVAPLPESDAALAAGTGTGPGTAPPRSTGLGTGSGFASGPPGAAGASATSAPRAKSLRLTLTSPGVAVGEQLRMLTASSREAHGFTLADLHGKPALIVLASRSGDGDIAPDLRTAIEREATARGIAAHILASDGEEPAVAVPHLPYAYAVDASGRVLARGAVNGLASVRTLFDAAR